MLPIREYFTLRGWRKDFVETVLDAHYFVTSLEIGRSYAKKINLQEGYRKARDKLWDIIDGGETGMETRLT